MWNSSDQLFSKTCGRILQFLLLLYQCSDIKQYSEKSFPKSSENNCDGVLLQWSCRLWGNWRKDFNNGFFSKNFSRNFSDQFFSKTASGESFWRTLWDFTSALEEVTVFEQVNVDPGPLGFIQIPEARMSSNTCRFQ